MDVLLLTKFKKIIRPFRVSEYIRISISEELVMEKDDVIPVLRECHCVLIRNSKSKVISASVYKRVH